MRALSLLPFLLLSGSAFADIIIYQNGALNSSWQDWSWGSTINYDDTSVGGVTSANVNSTQYSALSLYDTSVFGNSFAGLRFDVSGNNPDVSVSLSSSADSNSSASIAFTSFGANITSGSFTTLTMNFNDLPGSGSALSTDTWDRITWQAGTDGAVYNIDNIILLTEIVVPPLILSAEPLGFNTIAVTTQGNADTSSIKVTLNNKAVNVVSNSTMVPVDTPSVSITYLTLASPFAAGNITISTANGTFDFVLPAVTSGTINQEVTFPISDLIYGVNFPTDASYIQDLGITISRWGGNAVTAYNPNGDFTNAGADWYFENRDNGDSANDWVGWVQGAGSDAYMVVPALDWVAKDNVSYSYPISLYPSQEAFDPYNGEAGDGLYPNGSAVQPPTSQTLAYTPWNTAMASTWLKGMTNKPKFVLIDNEIEIASSTHQDMHPDPMGYDEELARVLNTSAVAKSALPGVLVGAPSTCSWWFYWRSEVGDPDVTSHNGSDFLPWFLDQLQAEYKATGKKPVDYLDLHYYFQADTSANDAAAKALRLRMTRSLWDPTYVDESWIATSTGNSQPNSSIVMLIPRMQTLLEEHYPNTKFSISEWDSTDDTDITGGLVTADSLGIFGKYKLDAATYWSDPDPTVPAGLAYWLYRGYQTYFGSSSVSVEVNNFNPDLLGIYAGNTNGKNLTLVIVNKDPSNQASFKLSGLQTGKYFLRHFGGQAGAAKFQTNLVVENTQYLTVPSYTAVFLQHVG